MHEGHRQRLKERYIKEGIAKFEDHQALELLLFYAIPRKDTNELAHALLDTFGSLKNLFEADVADIMNVPGVGAGAAALIKLIPDIAGKFWFAQDSRKISVGSIAKAKEYAVSLLYGKTTEHFYAVTTDASFNVKTATLISTGTTTQTGVPVRKVVEAVIRSGVDKLMVFHNHPGGPPRPSISDIELTGSIMNAVEPINVQLTDHIIVGEDGCYSFAEQQLVGGDMPKEKARTAQYAGGAMSDAAVYNILDSGKKL